MQGRPMGEKNCALFMWGFGQYHKKWTGNVGNSKSELYCISCAEYSKAQTHNWLRIVYSCM